MKRTHIVACLFAVAELVSAGPLCTPAQATEIVVASMAALQSAVNSASPGDTITLVNGTYVNATLTIGTSGITVRAATPGGVFMNGTQDINITGSHVTLSGFQFTSGNIDSASLIEVFGSHVRLTQLNFNGYHAKKYVVIMGGTQYNEMSYCNVENKPVTAVLGCTIQVHSSPTIPGYHRIRYCSFKNFPGPGGDYGNEPIRIGLSVEGEYVCRTTVEYCYFTSVGPGDSESISVKCAENVCRYNTFTSNPQGMLVFRHGNRNAAYGNFFMNNSGGIRIKEGNGHVVYNNYFATGAPDALKLQYVLAYPLANITLVHNTFVNMGEIDLGGSGPTGVTFANNIFKKTSGVIFSNPNGQTAWAGNIYAGTLGIAVASGMTNAEPLLAANGDGFLGLTAASPAIDASSANYPALLDIANVDDDPSVALDISGQPRPVTRALKDVGCDEYTTGGTINHPLSLSEVGPSYLGGPTSAVEAHDPSTLPERLALSQNYPNPFNASTHFTYQVGMAGLVSLKIHDVLGREVATLVEEVKQPGTYRVSWDAAQVGSGVYFCTMQAGGFAAARKVIVLK